MKSPCKNCVHNYNETIGHRTFRKCKLENNGFVYDYFWYHHTCTTQTKHEKCGSCKHLNGDYCESNYSDCRYERKDG